MVQMCSKCKSYDCCGTEIADLKAQVATLEAEKTALIAELVFNPNPPRQSSVKWQKWLDEGIAKAKAKAEEA